MLRTRRTAPRRTRGFLAPSPATIPARGRARGLLLLLLWFSGLGRAPLSDFQAENLRSLDEGRKPTLARCIAETADLIEGQAFDRAPGRGRWPAALQTG